MQFLSVFLHTSRNVLLRCLLLRRKNVATENKSRCVCVSVCAHAHTRAWEDHRETKTRQNVHRRTASLSQQTGNNKGGVDRVIASSYHLALRTRWCDVREKKKQNNEMMFSCMTCSEPYLLDAPVPRCPRRSIPSCRGSVAQECHADHGSIPRVTCPVGSRALWRNQLKRPNSRVGQTETVHSFLSSLSPKVKLKKNQTPIYISRCVDINGCWPFLKSFSSN